MSSRSGVGRWGRTSLTFVTSVSFLRFLVLLLRPVVLCALVINRVMLVCSGVFRWRPCAPGSAPARALLFSVLHCHCFMTLSQCLAVSLSCLACCCFVLSDMVVVSVASLALNFRSASLLRSCRVVALHVACFLRVAHLLILRCRHVLTSHRLNFSTFPVCFSYGGTTHGSRN